MGLYFGCYKCMVFWVFLLTWYDYSVFSVEANNITRSHSIRDGETLVSTGEKFAFGFFSPRGSDLRYVGIWYNKVGIQSIVWVANRERPISGNGGVVAIGNDGNLIITETTGRIIWSSNVTVAATNPTAILRDTGNLVLTGSEKSKRPLWQSFDHPTDTYLPDMEVHMNIHQGEKRVFTSWKSASDPSPGNYSMGVDPRGSPQIVIWNGGNRHWRSGHWNGLSFIGVPEVRTVYLFGFKLTNEGSGRVYFTYTPSDSSDLIKFQINWEGIERQERWSDEGNGWSLIQQHPVDECDWYNHCGAFGKCNPTGNQRCSCMEGFVPKDSVQWSRGNWSGGCIRRTELLRCEEGGGLSTEDGKTDGFVQVQNVKLPDFVDYVGNQDIEECQKLCLHNCSCMAYAVVSGINCMIWRQDLVDVRQFGAGGNALFVRVAHSELGDKNHVIKSVVITAVIIGVFLICISIWLLLHRKRKSHAVNFEGNPTTKVGPSREFSRNVSGASDLGQQPNGTELAMFSFSSLVTATDNFSDANKLGQGGFGHVYKGILPDGQEIAVKRLSRKSGQGLQEFTNEIMLLAKLQHRNLVRLLGGCVQEEEKILLYEYMPNKSLDSYLFDPDKKALLDWSKRFNIIEGIARGLLYLHRDSRLRIIHRDLKASNILLDEEMNPKISDFGMARIFGGNQNEANTNIVVGTYGYMAPEYAMEGLFSLKSDVYSFGVLLLEIVTGRRNTSFRSTDYSNMIAYAWDLWDRGRAIELVDPCILKSCKREVQVLRCIHVGMLCVQDMASHRPNMPSVVLMLESENAMLPRPSQPTFTSMRHNLDEDRWSANQDVISSNNVTISAILGR